MLFLGNSLKISSNYFIILPLAVITSSFGLVGGVIFGPLALPLNLLMFSILGHPEYAPENLYIAEISGIAIGVIMGYLSDFFDKMNREIQKRRITEEQLRRTLSDKEVLLEEVHHRVRNNLNIIKSLISLQEHRISDPVFKGECEKLRNRIFSISLVHDQLFQQGHSSRLDLREYLTSLLDNLMSYSVKSGIDLVTRWPDEEISLISDKAIYLGLIVHEVVLNAIKYAFQNTDFPQITFTLECRDDRIFLKIEDNGSGYSGGISSDGLGIKLINSLTSQLNGESSFQNRGGTQFLMNFPVK